jgi:hypothetical protein
MVVAMEVEPEAAVQILPVDLGLAVLVIKVSLLLLTPHFLLQRSAVVHLIPARRLVVHQSQSLEPIFKM